MLKLRASVALSAMFPKTRQSFDEMAKTLRFLQNRVSCVEFFYEGENPAGIGEILRECGLAAIYVAVIPQKERGMHLCETDPQARSRAVEFAKARVDEAAALGCESVMLCSGKIPQGTADIPAAEASFVRSVCEVMAHAEEKGYNLDFLLEPCDSAMDARHLLGPTGRTIRLVEEVHRSHFRFGLTMDTAHLHEEGEDILEALRATRHLCSHVHFANCITKNPEHPLYGDKHLSFDWPGGELGFAEHAEIFGRMESVYNDGRTVTLTLEVLCREDDPEAHFLRMQAGFPFHRK